MESVSCLGKRSVKVIQKYMSKIKTLEEINKLQIHIYNTIQIVRRAIKIKIHKENILESPFSLESTLSHLKYYRLKLKDLKKKLIISGRGLPTSDSKKYSVQWEDVTTCFDTRIRTGFISSLNIKDPLTFLKKSFKCFSIKIKQALEKSMIKVNVILSGNFIKPQNGEIDLKTFSTKNNPIDSATDLKQWYQDNVVDKLMTKLEEFAERDSGWALEEILGLKVNVNKFDPLKVGYSTFVSVPDYIKKKTCSS
jgi:hypothetical protein